MGLAAPPNRPSSSNLQTSAERDPDQTGEEYTLSPAHSGGSGSGSGSGSEPGRVRAPHNSCDQPPAATFRDGGCDPIPWQTRMYRGRGMP